MYCTTTPVFLLTLALVGAPDITGRPKACPRSTPAQYTLPPLPYSQDALSPIIDEQTMRIHHTGHHQSYVTTLNSLLQEHPTLAEHTLIDILTHKLGTQELRDQAGGHVNHTFFWHCMTPVAQYRALSPDCPLAQAIIKEFGSIDQFKEQFKSAAKGVFGSGWAWLAIKPHSKRLVIVTTRNQNNPVSKGLWPLLGLDVWEHAYYLRYFNKRTSYIDSWWDVVNWAFVEKAYFQALEGTCILDSLTKPATARSS